MTLKENMNKVTNFEIINVIWSLIASDDEVLPNPIIARLFEKLHDFKRSVPITREEKLELH